MHEMGGVGRQDRGFGVQECKRETGLSREEEDASDEERNGRYERHIDRSDEPGEDGRGRIVILDATVRTGRLSVSGLIFQCRSLLEHDVRNWAFTVETVC